MPSPQVGTAVIVEVPVLGPVILAASRSDKMRRFVSAAPGTKQVVDRFIAGETVEQVIPVVEDATAKGLEVTLDVVGEDITTVEQSHAARDAYLELVGRLKELGLGARAEMSVKLSMFGQALEGGHELALANVRPVVEAAAAIGTTVTLDAEDHTTLDSMFAIHEELRKDFPETGCVIQAYLFRTEDDARRLAAARQPGAYREGCVQGARLRRVPGQGGDRQGVRPHRQDPDGGRGLPHDRVARSAPDRHRPGAGPAGGAQTGRVRIPDAVRHPQ
ncbi:hypothetical protein GCM10020000_23660 [Streptomyces olivoverticillatus]